MYAFTKPKRMATYNIYLQYPEAMDAVKSIVDSIYGINNVEVIDSHHFMPPYIQFTSTLLTDEGINEHLVKIMIRSGFSPQTFVIRRLMS